MVCIDGCQFLLVKLEDFPGGSYGKASVYNVGDPGSIPGSGRSPGEGNGNPLQYYCLGNPWTEEPGRLQSMGVAESDMTEQLHFHFLLVKDAWVLPMFECV